MQLKEYQQSAIDKLEAYLSRVQELDAMYAFVVETRESYKSNIFVEIPYICIKIPTGGGKTLVGCHSVVKIMGSCLKDKLDRGIVMWFVPTEAIMTQTLKKLRDPDNPHRQILDKEFQKNVCIFSKDEALRIKKETVENNLCIVVCTLDSFRKEKTEDYKVYQENGELLSHFGNLENQEALEKDGEGTVINSLANVIRISNPLVVIDEGHRAKTKLSVDFLKDLNPSFIIEYTATPRTDSNILVDTSPLDLKNEEMIKIPIVLESSMQWEPSIAEGIKKRGELEKEAKKNMQNGGGYIRPIALIQAQPKNKNPNVQEVKEHLLGLNIPEDQIAIKTAKKNELAEVDLFSKDCKIRYIITVNALAEGWDCSFAYVLISAGNVGAKIAVEQIIGRIIRMPDAKRKKIESLNRSYIFASGKNFTEAAKDIVKGLERNGYTKYDLLGELGGGHTLGDPREIHRQVEEDFAVPLMSIEGEKLTFEKLIGEDFELANQSEKFDFKIHYDADGHVLLDIAEDGRQLSRSELKSLNPTYADKNCSKDELISWLDNKIRFLFLEKGDKMRFIQKAIDYQLKSGGKKLVELSVNRFVFKERLYDAIAEILERHAEGQFRQLLADVKISTEPFESFPEMILVNPDICQKFNKNYYESVDNLNNEELNFIERLDSDTLPNIKFWLRNREKQDPFYIQGWRQNKFYPDFVAMTQQGNIVALEWKGEYLLDTKDTEYKEAIAEEWAKLGKGKLHFFLVHKTNQNEVLTKLKAL